MPAIQRGQAYRLGPNRWGLRWYDAAGVRRRKSPSRASRAALAHYRDMIEPELRGDPAPMPELTLAEFVALYLERHAASVRPRTIATLRERLALRRRRAFGDVPLRELERMSGELAAWQAQAARAVPLRRVQALRQTLEAACRWGYIATNPAKLAGRNRQPTPRAMRVYTADELEAIAAELSPIYLPLPVVRRRDRPAPRGVAGTGAARRRPRRHGSRLSAGLISDGEIVGARQDYGRSRRQVPLSRARWPRSTRSRRGSTRRCFSRPRGGLLDLDNWRRREWAPAIEAAGIQRPARIYDLRSTFASDALAAGVCVFELARIMGTSVRDDRAPLRRPVGRRGRGHRQAPGRARCGAVIGPGTALGRAAEAAGPVPHCMDGGNLHERYCRLPVTGVRLAGSRWGGRKLPCRLPAQDLDAHHGQHGENHDHQDLPEVVDRGKERQPDQEEERREPHRRQPGGRAGRARGSVARRPRGGRALPEAPHR